jgi:hypothetical protein
MRTARSKKWAQGGPPETYKRMTLGEIQAMMKRLGETWDPRTCSGPVRRLTARERKEYEKELLSREERQ